jgi:hypothetical protein
MLRFLPVLVLSLTILPNVAAAQSPGAGRHHGTLVQQRACRTDVLRFCRDMEQEGDYAMADCLKANNRRLSPRCRQALESGER